jgi:hypothetical protein
MSAKRVLDVAYDEAHICESTTTRAFGGLCDRIQGALDADYLAGLPNHFRGDE